MRTCSRWLCALLLLLGAAGCNSEYTSSHQPQSDALVARLHDAIRHGAWEALPRIYDPSYLEQNDRREIARRWEELTRRFGPIRSFRLQASQHDARLQGEFYFYRYAVLFDHGSAEETITVYRSSRTGRLAVSGHRVEVNRG